jgi:hypothetical protein
MSGTYREDLVRKNYILKINAEEFVEIGSRM